MLKNVGKYIDDAEVMGLPLVIIIDTYAATHHGDENSSVGTTEWFRSANLGRQFNATLFITHHVRKQDQKVEIKTPSDMKAAVRGSSAFIASCRTVLGVREMPHGDAVIKELPREAGSKLFNAGILKTNTGISWEDRSDPRYPEPMIIAQQFGE